MSRYERASKDREQHGQDYTDTKQWYFDIYVPAVVESMRQSGRDDKRIELKQKALLEAGKNPDVIEQHIAIMKEWRRTHP